MTFKLAKTVRRSIRVSTAAALTLLSTQALAVCTVSFGQLKTALDQAVADEGSGLDNPMWATVVDRNGRVCAVAFSGSDRSAVWPGSRVISAQKANTGNAFSTNELALSSANLFAAVQPGGSLFGLQESNPVDVAVAYDGPPSAWGTSSDPLVGKRIGGVNVFGGGLALYDASGIIGGLGASGDTSCADHNIAWRIRANLNLDQVLAGVSGDAQRPDNIVFDISGGVSAGGFGHPTCLNAAGSTTLPPVGP